MRRYTFIIHLASGDERAYLYTARTDLDAFKQFCCEEAVQALSHDEVSHTEFFSVAFV